MSNKCAINQINIHYGVDLEIWGLVRNFVIVLLVITSGLSFREMFQHALTMNNNTFWTM